MVVLDPRERFTFIPSLIWLPFGVRDADDITFPLQPMYERKGIEFVHQAAGRVDAESHSVTTSSGRTIDYDKLLVATGPRLAFDKIPGLGPEHGFTQSVCNIEHAELARAAWERFLERPGPVVVGTAQGGSCFGASYEFLFNIHHRIRKAGLQEVAPVTFITAEPFLGHFGLGGVGDSSRRVQAFLQRLGIEGIPNNVIREVRDGEIELDSGRVLPFAYSMIVPPFTGVDAVRESEGLANPMGFVPIDDRFRHPDHPDVYAAGVATAIAPPEPTQVPAGVPKTGQMSETMAKVAARNIVADITGAHHRELAIGDLSRNLRPGRGQQRHHLQGRPRAGPRAVRQRPRAERPCPRRPVRPLGQARLRALLPGQPQAWRGRPLIPAVVDMGTETKTDRKASAVRALTDR